MLQARRKRDRYVNPFKPKLINNQAEQSYYRDKCDKVMSRYFRSLGRCELRGFKGIECFGGLEHHHIVKRGVLPVRHHKKNGLCICRSHHVWVENHKEEAKVKIDNLKPGLRERLETEGKISYDIDFKEKYAFLVANVPSWRHTDET